GGASNRGRRLVDVDAADHGAGRVTGLVGGDSAHRLPAALAEGDRSGTPGDARERVAAGEGDGDLGPVPAPAVGRAVGGAGDRRRGLVHVEVAQAGGGLVAGHVKGGPGGRLGRALAPRLGGRAAGDPGQGVAAGEADGDVVPVPAVRVRRAVGRSADRRRRLVEVDRHADARFVAGVVHGGAGRHLARRLDRYGLRVGATGNAEGGVAAGARHVH